MTPSHAYIPGETARHDEGAFDAIRATVAPGMSPEELSASDAFRSGLRYLNEGYFWEAHEVLEPVWMACRQNSPEQAFVRGLIQLANARLKARMGQHRAADRLRLIALDLFGESRGRGGAACLEEDVVAWQEICTKMHFMTQR